MMMNLGVRYTGKGNCCDKRQRSHRVGLTALKLIPRVERRGVRRAIIETWQ